MSRASYLVPGEQPPELENPVVERAYGNKQPVRRVGGFLFMLVAIVIGIGFAMVLIPRFADEEAISSPAAGTNAEHAGHRAPSLQTR